MDHTFNLGKFYVTAFVNKNLKVDTATTQTNTHSLVLGPAFIHRESTFEAFNYFFSTVKSSFSSDLRLGTNIHIGSDEGKAITKAFNSNFTAANRFLCTKHLKDGIRMYMQTKVGVPQKDRNDISEAIFGRV